MNILFIMQNEIIKQIGMQNVEHISHYCESAFRV